MPRNYARLRCFLVVNWSVQSCDNDDDDDDDDDDIIQSYDSW